MKSSVTLAGVLILLTILSACGPREMSITGMTKVELAVDYVYMPNGEGSSSKYPSVILDWGEERMAGEPIWLSKQWQVYFPGGLPTGLTDLKRNEQRRVNLKLRYSLDWDSQTERMMPVVRCLGFELLN
jgi:hypothetical protein